MSTRRIPRRDLVPTDTHAEEPEPDKRSWRRSKTLEGAVVSEGIDQIIKLEAAYDRMSADALANRWETARRYAEELDAGRSQRETARLVGKDHKHVGWMADVWREHAGDLGPQRPFNPLYQAAKKAIATAEKKTEGGDGNAAVAAAERRGTPRIVYTAMPFGKWATAKCTGCGHSEMLVVEHTCDQPED
jgi:hypothetical protein